MNYGAHIRNNNNVVCSIMGYIIETTNIQVEDMAMTALYTKVEEADEGAKATKEGKVAECILLSEDQVKFWDIFSRLMGNNVREYSSKIHMTCSEYIIPRILRRI